MNVDWVFQILLIFAFTFYLHYKYANWHKQHPAVLLPTLIGWYFSFLIILMLPLDISLTFYQKCLIQHNYSSVIDKNDRSLRSLATATEEAPLYFSTTPHEQLDMKIEPSMENSLPDEECERPKGYIANNQMLIFWRVIYWSSQFLTWLMLPLLQSYSKAGEFTAVGRLKYALYSNTVYYGIYLAMFFLFLFYAISKGIPMNFDSLKVLVVSASNTWGLFWLVVLLGYGLVEVPRRLFHKADHDYRLRRAYFDVENIFSNKNDAEETLIELYLESKRAFEFVKTNRYVLAWDKIEQILSKFPTEFVEEKINANKSSSRLTKPYDLESKKPLDSTTFDDDLYLVSLHRRVIKAVYNYDRYQAQWVSLISTALFLEDVEKAINEKRLPSNWAKTSASVKNSEQSVNQIILFLRSQFAVFNAHPVVMAFKYHWYVHIWSPFFKMLGLLATSMALVVLWSECFFWIVRPFSLSLVAQILHRLALGYHYKYLQICAIILLTFMGICAYSTIFRLKIYRYYHLNANQMTNENSIIFSAMLLCRLTAPMCFNFIGMANLDAHVTLSKIEAETQFTKLMGHLDLIPFIARGVNIYAPILMVIIALGSWFKVGTHFLHALGIDQFMEDDSLTIESVRNGRALVILEKNRHQRFTSSPLLLGQKGADDEEMKLLSSFDNGEMHEVESDKMERGIGGFAPGSGKRTSPKQRNYRDENGDNDDPSFLSTYSNFPHTPHSIFGDL